MSDIKEKRDLVLSPNSYVYMQDMSKGSLKTYTGPTVVNPTAQERPVVYKHGEGFSPSSLESAVQEFSVAPQGYYLVLFNPTVSKTEWPGSGQCQPSPDLVVGRRVNIPGPCHFALWPGQMTQLIRGHELRSNQYLLCRVYDADEALKNWEQGVVKPASEGEGETKAIRMNAPKELSPGMLLVIQGTDVSFYIPPTGITVVPDSEDAEGKPTYVRSALTLERLEYAVLVDENGKKRYEHGPQVVFPRPTERFVVDSKGERKFAAIELNEIQGIHIKVISEYEEMFDGKMRKFNAGEEIFITGKNTPIYYPREEHSVVTYDGKTKHFASAVPAGEARYVMDRKTGDIETSRGPTMLLPNPVDKVIVRRPLSDHQCELWYPGNTEVLEYNRSLREASKNAPTTRQGAVSEGDLIRSSQKRGGQKRSSLSAQNLQAALGSVAYASNASEALLEHSSVNGDQRFMADEFSRASTYTQPRSITLSNKFSGVPTINLWNGYACAVSNKAGNQRIEIGPKPILIDYDEDLDVLELSTGRPKTTDKLYKTVFLQVTSNRVSDKMLVATKDMVNIEIYVNYQVDFSGDPMKWFSVSNYVKVLCDRARSILKSAVRKMTIDEFYSNATDIIRNLILGAKGPENADRPGLVFSQNGMTVKDLDVMSVEIKDDRVKDLLDKAQHDAVRGTLSLTAKARELEHTTKGVMIDGEIARIKHQATIEGHQLTMELASKNLEVQLLNFANQLRVHNESLKTQEAEQLIVDMVSGRQRQRNEMDARQKLDLSKTQMELTVAQLVAETQSVMQRMGAASGSFSEAVAALHEKTILERVAQAWAVPSLLGGKDLSDVLSKVFEKTPLGPMLAKFVLPAGPNGSTATPIVPRT